MKGLPEGVEIPKVRPVNEQILVYLEPDAVGFSNAPSLVKPDSAKADHVFRFVRIISKGDGVWNKKKTVRAPIRIDVGARCVIVKFVATHTRSAESIQHLLGKDFALIGEKDLIMEVDEDVKLEDIGQ